MISTPVEALMRERLSVLAPESIDIQDESSQHAGHEGAKGGGGHYWMTIVSATFTGHSRIERHRLIYDALGDLMQQRIHALSIKAYTPEEM